MVCLYCLLAMPVQNLALQVFKRYHDELCQAISSCPMEVAAVLYSSELVTSQEKSHAVDTPGLIPFRKAESLVQAIERRIVTENSAILLRKFCQVLRKHREVGSIVSRMNLRLSK